jgi:murein DD-endopeptidase MepM/ murein hydrolase activator NlpD
MSASSGTPIRSTADGVVSFSGWTAPSGNVVILEHGFGFSTVYAHNMKNVVKVGQKIKRGDLLGYVGSTKEGAKVNGKIEMEVDENRVIEFGSKGCKG